MGQQRGMALVIPTTEDLFKYHMARLPHLATTFTGTNSKPYEPPGHTLYASPAHASPAIMCVGPITERPVHLSLSVLWPSGAQAPNVWPIQVPGSGLGNSQSLQQQRGVIEEVK